MKKSLVCVLLVFISNFLIAGCTELKQNTTPTGSQASSTKQIKEESHLSANYYYLKYRIHIKNKDYEQALTSLEKAIAIDSGSFTLTRELAQLYLRQNNDKKALAVAENLVRQNPDNVDGLLFLIQLKKDGLDKKELVEMLNRILSLDPKNKETFLRLAQIYIDQKNHSEALVLLKKMVGLFPDYYVARFYLGKVYLSQKQYELAEKQFLKTIELEPNLVEPRFQLINIFNFQKGIENNQKILDAYKKILEIEPGNYQAKLGKALYHYKNKNKAEATKLFKDIAQDFENDSRIIMMSVNEYISGKKYEDAVIVFSQMLKGNPENQTLNFFAGIAYEEIKDFKKAIFHYGKIKPGHSQYKKTILNIAFLHQKSENTQTAINYLEEKYNNFPEDVDILSYLASFYENENVYDKAISLYKKGLESAPEDTSLLFRLGAVQDKAGFKEDSLSAMKKIIKIDPNDASALNYLGYSYADKGIKLDEALLLIKKALKIKPDDGYITDSLGWVYFKRGEYDKAILYLEKAAELTSFETIISDHLGDVYQITKQFKKALKTYKKAIANAKEEDKDKVLEIRQKIQAVQKKIND